MTRIEFPNENIKENLLILGASGGKIYIHLLSGLLKHLEVKLI